MYPAYWPQQLRTPLLTHSGLYAEVRPDQSLREHIVCYWMAPVGSDSCSLGARLDEPLVPDGCIDLVILRERRGEEIRGLLVGPLETPARVTMELDRFQTFGVRFYPGGLHPFLREPAHLFTGRIESLPNICPPLWRELRALTERYDTLEGLAAAVDRLFTARLWGAGPLPWQATLMGALDLFTAVPDGLSVRRLAKHLVVSERQLLRVFLDRTGLSPKQFVRTIRFQHALSLINRRGRPALSEIALSCGYYDQAHFTREFAALAGITPGRYAASGGFLQDAGWSEPVD